MPTVSLRVKFTVQNLTKAERENHFFRVALGRRLQPTWRDVDGSGDVSFGADGIAALKLEAVADATSADFLRVTLFSKRWGHAVAGHSGGATSHLDEWFGPLKCLCAEEVVGSHNKKFSFQVVQGPDVEKAKGSDVDGLKAKSKAWISVESDSLLKTQTKFLYKRLAQVNFYKVPLPSGDMISGGEFCRLVQHTKHKIFRGEYPCTADSVYLTLMGLSPNKKNSSKDFDNAKTYFKGKDQLSFPKEFFLRTPLYLLERWTRVAIAHVGGTSLSLGSFYRTRSVSKLVEKIHQLAASQAYKTLGNVARCVVSLWGITSVDLTDLTKTFRNPCPAPSREPVPSGFRDQKGTVKLRDQLVTFWEEGPLDGDRGGGEHGGDCDDKAMAGFSVTMAFREAFLAFVADPSAAETYPNAAAVAAFLAAYSPSLGLCDVDTANASLTTENDYRGDRRRRQTSADGPIGQLQAHCVLVLLRTVSELSSVRAHNSLSSFCTQRTEMGPACPPRMYVVDCSWESCVWPPESAEVKDPGKAGGEVDALSKNLFGKGWVVGMRNCLGKFEAVRPPWLDFVAFVVWSDAVLLFGGEYADLCPQVAESGVYGLNVGGADDILAAQGKLELKWLSPLALLGKTGSSASSHKALTAAEVDELFGGQQGPPSHPYVRGEEAKEELLLDIISKPKQCEGPVVSVLARVTEDAEVRFLQDVDTFGWAVVDRNQRQGREKCQFIQFYLKLK
jgi:hypothetical protein